jgi:alpha-L-rhamnosidase
MTSFNFRALITAFLFLAIANSAYGNPRSLGVFPYALKCDHLIMPIGVDSEHPRLSWKLNDNRQNAMQTAYQLTVATDSSSLLKNNTPFYTTGKVKGAKNLINYAGQALEPFTKYYWKVEVWDKDGKPNSSIAISSFETGMMKMANWLGTWISDGIDINKLPAPYFRKDFYAGKKVKSARAYIAAAGLYELYIDGKKVGNHRLDPMYTRYDRRNLYVSYDVTPYLTKGKNAVGVLLGNGWYNHQSLAVWDFDQAPWRGRPAFCLDLRITYDDGSFEVITSDDTWKTHSGPLVFNSIYTAEHYDARLEQPGWNAKDFNDKGWGEIMLRAAPSQNIVSQAMEPIRNVEELHPKSIQKLNDTTYVFDLGRNIAGVTRLIVDGKKGTVIHVKHGERLDKNGKVDLSNIDVYYRPKDSTDPFQTDIWTLNGNPHEEFMPKFNYKGFQYIEVTSTSPLKLNKNSITAYFMHSDVPAIGQISSSNPLIDKLWQATNSSYLSNLFGYPTDCPQREKNGWTGDGHFGLETGLYNFDGITVYEKWLADHRDEQQPNGVLPDIIPTGGWGYGTANGTDWTSTIAIIPWNIYMFYGDSKSLSDCYGNIKKYVNYVEHISPHGLTTFGRGDWVPVKSKSSLEYTSSVYYFVDADILAKAAKLFNKADDYKYYTALAKKIRIAINRKYLKESTGMYGSGTQTELSMALQWGIVPEDLKSKVAENLARRVESDGMHLDVGVLGARAVLTALSDNGQADVAYELAAQDSYPSWGWWIKNGATTLYENWDINAKRDISMNHMMFGEIGGWLFKGIGGINIDEANPGFSNTLLKPNFVKGLNQFEASHEGPYGTIVSSWKRRGAKVLYEVVVPANSKATIYFPQTGNKCAYIGGTKISSSYEVGAGKYEFEVR